MTRIRADVFFSAVSVLFNLAVLYAFASTASSLYAYGTARFDAAGGFATLKTLGGALTQPDQAAAIAFAPASVLGVLRDFGLAWFSLVAAAGCAWMALLGLRWLFHALRRGAMVLNA